MRLIDADALEYDTEWSEYHDGFTAYSQLAIDTAPSIDIEPKRGEWIDRSDGGRILNPWWENYECNRCGYYGSGTWNFCPNCGASMREREGE